MSSTWYAHPTAQFPCRCVVTKDIGDIVTIRVAVPVNHCEVVQDLRNNVLPSWQEAYNRMREKHNTV